MPAASVSVEKMVRGSAGKLNPVFFTKASMFAGRALRPSRKDMGEFLFSPVRWLFADSLTIALRAGCDFWRAREFTPSDG